MTYVEKHIINTYSELFRKLNTVSRVELLKKLAKSHKEKNNDEQITFFKSFGAFGSNMSAEEINRDIKNTRRFLRDSFKL